MSMLYVWNPRLRPNDPHSVYFFLTYGDAEAIGRGTKTFIEHVLRDLHIEASVQEWSIEPYRSNYFTDYLDEDDWRDVWQLVFRARVTSTEEVRLPTKPVPYVGSDAGDDSWSPKDVLDAATAIGCLVVSDFEADSALKQALGTIEHDDILASMRNRYGVGTPQLALFIAPQASPQLQIDLGKFPSEFYASGADYAERVLALCKQFGGTVHYAGES